MSDSGEIKDIEVGIEENAETAKKDKKIEEDSSFPAKNDGEVKEIKIKVEVANPDAADTENLLEQDKEPAQEAKTEPAVEQEPNVELKSGVEPNPESKPELSPKKQTNTVTFKEPESTPDSQENGLSHDQLQESKLPQLTAIEKTGKELELDKLSKVTQLTAMEKAVKDIELDKLYKCRFCGLSYNYMLTLKAHERVHDVEEPYVCAKCGESFRYYSEYDYHLKTHKNQKGYKCQCGRTFFRYTDLLYHKHPGEDDEPQELEEPSSSGALKLLHPLRITADMKKPYICQYCSKAYGNGSDLKSHMYSHRGERSFNVRSSRYMMTRTPDFYADYTIY